MTFCHFGFLEPNFLLSTCNSISDSYPLFWDFLGPSEAVNSAVDEKKRMAFLKRHSLNIQWGGRNIFNTPAGPSADTAEQQNRNN